MEVRGGRDMTQEGEGHDSSMVWLPRVPFLAGRRVLDYLVAEFDLFTRFCIFNANHIPSQYHPSQIKYVDSINNSLLFASSISMALPQPDFARASVSLTEAAHEVAL